MTGNIALEYDDISTHSAREDGDSYEPGKGYQRGDFNPLRPRGRRPRFVIEYSVFRDFNPLRPRGRRPNIHNLKTDQYGISTHSAREDGDPFYI